AHALGLKNPDQLLGRSFMDFVAPPMVSEVAANFKTAVETGRTREANVVDIVRADGTGGVVEVKSVPILVDGKVTGMRGVLRDITERRLAEEAIRESETRFRTLFETAHDAIFIMNAQVFLDCNPQAEVLLGCRKADIVGRSPLAFSPPIQPDGRPSPEKAGEKIAAALAGSPQFFEWKHVQLDGSPIDVEVSLNRFAIGDASYLQAIVRNVAEHRQAQVLQEAVYRIAAATGATASLADLYREIHQTISSVMPAENFYITIYDVAQDILRFPYFKDIADEPFVGEIQTGKGLSAYVLRTGKSLLCTQAVHNELERRGEIKLLGAPSAIWLGVPLIVEGTTIGVMVVQHYSDPKAYGVREQQMLEFVSTQIAAAIHRKQAEQQVLESEAQYRNLVTDMSDGVFVTDEHGVLTYGNPALARAMGLENPYQLLGRSFMEFVAPSNPGDVSQFFQDAVETGRARQETVVDVVRADGTSGVVEVKPTPIMLDGKMTGMRGVLRDITQRRQADRENMAQLEELRRWQTVMLGREKRIRDLKREANELLGKAGLPPRYASVDAQDQSEE
ncbi:MAG: PAS domain S-box protein, partial [Chloroflexota bacterium]